MRISSGGLWTTSGYWLGTASLEGRAFASNVTQRMKGTKTVLRRTILYFRNVYIGRDMIPRSMQAILDFMMKYKVLKACASTALTCMHET